MENSDVVVRDVMMRDGLQNLRDFIPTDVKIELFQRLAASGLQRIEFTSFVSPKAVPQFADASQVARAVLPITPTGVEASALIPNLKGAQLALENGVRRLAFVMSVSESHNLNNVRRSTAESIDELKRILALKAGYPELIVEVGMATVFGCPFEGKISPKVVLQFVQRFYEVGIRGMTVADTVGFGNPKQIREVCKLCLSEFPDVVFSVHLHNTRGLGLANAVAAYESGIRIIDGAVGGLGGCPFAPGARGNTATEDLVYLFGSMGVTTGVNIDALLDIARYFQGVKPNIHFASNILEAGVPKYLGAITRDGTEQKRN